MTNINRYMNELSSMMMREFARQVGHEGLFSADRRDPKAGYVTVDDLCFEATMEAGTTGERVGQ
jgi:hypothetical protein